MSLKFHFIAITGIILLVFMVIKLGSAPAKVNDAPQGRVITISRANWGVNCKRIPGKSPPQPVFADDFPKTDPLRENNALEEIKRLCNGKKSCDLEASVKKLEFDPAPHCSSKTLEVEYRCFAYDRPWRVEVASNRKAEISCKEKE